MKLSIITFFILLISHITPATSQPRVVVMTDFPPVDVVPGGKAVYKWRKQVQEDFAKRAAWMLP